MRRVFVVDDNEPLVEDLVELFESEGHEVVCAYDGDAALLRAHEFAYHVALVDIRMPGIDGITLVRQLLPVRPRARHLFMTGYSNDQALSEAAALSQHAVLDKPLDLDRVLGLIASD